MDVNEVINELCAYEQELEWFECKENWFDPVELGEYISAIANSAAIEGRSYGYFVWGINDQMLLPNHNDWKMLIKLSHYCLI